MVQKLKTVFDKCVMKVAMVRKRDESNKQSCVDSMEIVKFVC
jgi:hypothetical protein